MQEWIVTLFAYAILSIGPVLGTIAVMRNSSKLTSALMHGAAKAGKYVGKFAGKAAQGLYDRSPLAQARDRRREASRVERERRHLVGLQDSKSIPGRIARAFLNPEAKRALDTSLLDAKSKIEDSQVAGHVGGLTKSAAIILSSGYTKDVTDTSEKGSWVRTDPNTGEVSKIKGQDLDGDTRTALNNAHNNGLVGTKLGSRAIAQMLIQTDSINTNRMDYLASQIADDSDRAMFVENTRKLANEKGYENLKFMAARPDGSGEIDYLGVTRDPTKATGSADLQRGQTMIDLAKKNREKGYDGLTKYVFDETDEDYTNEMGKGIIEDSTNPAARGLFEQQLTRMPQENVIKMAKMVARSQAGRAALPHFGDDEAGKKAREQEYINRFTKMQSDASASNIGRRAAPQQPTPPAPQAPPAPQQPTTPAPQAPPAPLPRAATGGAQFDQNDSGLWIPRN